MQRAGFEEECEHLAMGSCRVAILFSKGMPNKTLLAWKWASRWGTGLIKKERNIGRGSEAGGEDIGR